MGNLPFERDRYNRTPEVTPEEAERNKRQQSEQDAARGDPRTAGDDAPPAKSDKATG